MTKAEMRRWMKAKLAAIDPAALAEGSAAVARNLAASEPWKRSRLVLCFLSMLGELDTAPLIAAARADGKSVAVPRIEGSSISFRLLRGDPSSLPRDRWGIPVPDPSWPAAEPAAGAPILVITPGLAFDRLGNRLGRGGGCYDGFLREARSGAALTLTAMGACLSVQLVAEAPHDERDQRVDAVATDEELILLAPPYYIAPGVQRMGVIKSAYEIAMENVKGIEGNKELVEANRLRDEGKRMVSKILEGAAFNIKEALKGFEKRQLAWVREGLIQSLLANLVLPIDEFSLKSSKKLGEAVAATAGDARKILTIFSQLENFFKEYVGERKRVIDAVEKQYAPKLRKKEEELSRQLGRPVKINPVQDPEYQAMVRQYLSQLDLKYTEVLEGAKEEIKALFNKTPA
jgi:5,10-methenyltetrahydrofolate synthetase